MISSSAGSKLLEPSFLPGGRGETADATGSSRNLLRSRYMVVQCTPSSWAALFAWSLGSA
jgi:hypothetical protein